MYDDDLAGWYDPIYEARHKDYRGEAAQLARLIRSHQPHARTLLDVGCGTGEHLRYLREEFTVAGVDHAEPMLTVARAKLPGVPLYQADMRAFDLGRRYDVVTCLFGAIGEVGSRAGLDAAMACLTAHLRPEGVLLIEPWLLRESWQDGQVSHTLARFGDRTLVRLCRRWTDGGVACLDLHYLIADPAGVRYRTAEHRALLFTRQEHEDACRAAGIEVTFVHSGLSGRGLFVGRPD